MLCLLRSHPVAILSAEVRLASPISCLAPGEVHIVVLDPRGAQLYTMQASIAMSASKWTSRCARRLILSSSWCSWVKDREGGRVAAEAAGRPLPGALKGYALCNTSAVYRAHHNARFRAPGTRRRPE